MSAPVKKCEVTPLEALRRLYDVARKVDASESGEFETLLQGELVVAESVLRDAAATLATDGERDAALFELSNFEDGQWWVKELDEAVENGTGDQKRAVAVVRSMLKVAARAVYHANVDAAAPVVPVAAQPVVQVPTAWRYEWASCITSDGPQDFRLKLESDPPPDWAVEDGQARNIVALYAAPSLEAQPAWEASAPNAALVALKEACDLIRLEVADGVHTEEYRRGMAALSAAGQEVGK